MSTNTIFILALILFDGVAVAWGVWEFWSARPDKNKAKQPPSELSERSRHPER